MRKMTAMIMTGAALAIAAPSSHASAGSGGSFGFFMKFDDGGYGVFMKDGGYRHYTGGYYKGSGHRYLGDKTYEGHGKRHNYGGTYDRLRDGYQGQHYGGWRGNWERDWHRKARIERRLEGQYLGHRGPQIRHALRSHGFSDIRIERGLRGYAVLAKRHDRVFALGVHRRSGRIVKADLVR